MNNPKTLVLGWGSLVVAAGIGYVMARKDVNERRQNQAVDGSRPPEKLDWQARIALAEAEQASKSTAGSGSSASSGVSESSPSPAAGGGGTSSKSL